MALTDKHLSNLQRESFVECPSGQISRSVCVSNPSDEPIPVTVDPAGTPEIFNVVSPGTIDTEFIQALPDGTKRFEIKVRDRATLKFSFTSTESGSKYITVPPRVSYQEEGLSLTSMTLYMQVDKISQVVEIITYR